MNSRVPSRTGIAGPVNFLPDGSGNLCAALKRQAAGGGEIFQLTGCGEGAEGLREALAGCGHGAVSFRSFPRVFPDFAAVNQLKQRKIFQNNCIDTNAPPLSGKPLAGAPHAPPLSFSPSGIDGSALAGTLEVNP